MQTYFKLHCRLAYFVWEKSFYAQGDNFKGLDLYIKHLEI